MSEWPRVCTHINCRGNAIPATGRWESRVWGALYYCERHSRLHGALYKALGYQWSRLPDSSQAQPTSEGVQP